jgi:hypothetical protein
VPETRPTRLPRDWFVYLSVVAFVAVAVATERIWRSARAWMPVDRVMGVFRLAWLVVPVLGLAATVAAVSAVLVA